MMGRSNEASGTGRSRDWVALIATGGATAVGIVYVLGGAALYFKLLRAGVPPGEALDDFSSRRFIVVGAVVTFLAVVVAAVLGGLALGLLRPQDRAGPLRLTPILAAFVGVVLGFVVFAYLALPLRLREATVETRHAGCLRGPFIGSDGEGIHLAAPHELRTISSDQITELRLGRKVDVKSQGIKPVPCPK